MAWPDMARSGVAEAWQGRLGPVRHCEDRHSGVQRGTAKHSLVRQAKDGGCFGRSRRLLPVENYIKIAI
jgi:hypothetical protein